jgi:hypothetical protein
VWKLAPTDLLQLKGGGGSPFADFVDRLIRAEAACGGLAQSEIATQLRVNIPDGGVDTEVKKTIPCHASGWFTVPTCWQFKGGDAKDIDDRPKKKKANGLQEEIRKPYVAELIKKGYGYRFCILDDLPSKKVKNWQSQLLSEARAINPHAVEPCVVHGGDLLNWAERFPAVVALLRNHPEGGLLWEAWAANCVAETPRYVSNPDWDHVRNQIVQHVQFDNPCVGGESCLFIGGAAGVGKTRLVFESLAELLQVPSLVIVAEDDQKAGLLAAWLANASSQVAILVADECSAEMRFGLNHMLRGHQKRVRVITINNRDEPFASAAGRILSPVDSLKNTEAILTANFPSVSEDHRRNYAQLSRGFIRLAADMCKHDSDIAAGQMLGFLSSVVPYVRHRVGAAHLPLISAIALFHQIGWKNEVAIELELLCILTGKTKQDFYDAVRAVRESPGFVVQAGRYWYVTPEIVGRVLFDEGWQRWVAPSTDEFFKQVPQNLQQQVLERVATLGTKEVRDQVSAFFRKWFGGLSAAGLANSRAASFAAAVVEISPEEYLPLLRLVIENAQPGELERIEGYAPNGGWGPRRTLVWLLERLVCFPEFFSDCEACLFRLSVEESERQMGSNATEVWASLFSTSLSGTAIPYFQRLPILEKRTASPVLAEARSAFGALIHALRRPVGRIAAAPFVAGRPRPDDWRPETIGDERACYRAALEICGRHLNDASQPHHSLAFDVVVHNVDFLLFVGLVDDLRRIVDPKNLSEVENRMLLQGLEKFLARQRLGENGKTNERAASYLEGVQEWSGSFRPTDFSGRLREVCAREPWDQRFSDNPKAGRDEADQLACEIIQRPELLVLQLDWLASPEAHSAQRLGFALGRTDLSGECGILIFEHAIAKKAAALLRGYVRGMAFEERRPNANFIALMAKLESAHPEIAVDIMVVAGDIFDAFPRILRLVDTGTVSVRYLANLSMGLGRRELTQPELSTVLQYFVRAANQETDVALTGVPFVLHLLFRSQDAGIPPHMESDPVRSLVWQYVENVLRVVSRQGGLEWVEIVKKLAACDGDRAVRLLAKALLADDISLRYAAVGELGAFSDSLSETMMESLGSVLLDEKDGWRLQISVLRDIVCKIPSEIVLAWVRQHGVVAARVVARHLPHPLVDQSGEPIVPIVLDTILREFDDEVVFLNFLAGTHSGEAWWGNGAGEFRRAAANAKKFLNHPNPRIREWAKNEIAYCHSVAEREDQQNEEMFLST